MGAHGVARADGMEMPAQTVGYCPGGQLRCQWLEVSRGPYFSAVVAHSLERLSAAVPRRSGVLAI
jgi:hypothetical protein